MKIIKTIILLLILITGLSSCVEDIHPNIKSFVVSCIQSNSAGCTYISDDYFIVIIDTCNKYKIGDTIKFIK
jgi:hypothetical protein